ncbi:hypothetical protein PSMK_31340 [Phycisphaera mikurensis NBRC 102666]|uniref:Uncharacterized protein n=1 Tax=Phycisphaera mikurensis (strain NBRC 102666 / KCTC 22515 / FYK2301M01) TaxID=1142394 RepID=I0IJ55_PHYMF|nr:hypothetical protein PSMK_31340 [Phycisphaera mikurensis NBRC 102666]
MSQDRSGGSEPQRDTERVEIKRASTWGFSNEVRVKLSAAYDALYRDPEEAVKELRLAVSLAEILGAAASSGGGEELRAAAAELSRFTQEVQNRTRVNPDDLSGPGAAVTLGIARVQLAEARAGLERGDESMFAYSLDSAAANLLQAHVYRKQAPGEDAARAIFNADRLAEQVEALIHPTTQQGGVFAVSVPEEDTDTEDIGLLEDAGGGDGGGEDRSMAEKIPSIAAEVLDALDTALNAAAQASN